LDFVDQLVGKPRHLSIWELLLIPSIFVNDFGGFGTVLSARNRFGNVRDRFAGTVSVRQIDSGTAISSNGACPLGYGFIFGRPVNWTRLIAVSAFWGFLSMTLCIVPFRLKGLFRLDNEPTPVKLFHCPLVQ
jgi:hypothetical protein